MPDLVSGATLVEITKENYEAVAGGNTDLLASFAENLGMGVPQYMLTYTSAEPSNAVLEVSPYQQIMLMPMSAPSGSTTNPSPTRRFRSPWPNPKRSRLPTACCSSWTAAGT